ncbi:peptide deformylase [Conexibacter sp. JD483]|uniref:peptide deformylase n=1 Tax=unclassified Conexibacter TaxID=2627773 RepID=UPI0027238DBC|nr:MULTISPECIES: peptide deformylase [unclassified Conexibacter]MDO8184571.1 peptide deformylase [Conexibacter sp. CPCC 205706]MDO8197877.1 peptide deformylase [Conexibacter sp. CPCC 205762]MDR9370077.1 peptide deformylase [Conexibacter sp. JD483]
MAERDDSDNETEIGEAPRLDPETAARRNEAIRYVRQFGDPVLKSKAMVVTQFDDDLRAQIEGMGEIMNDSLGIGLAATQLGKLNRVLVYRVEQDSPVIALVNPQLEWSGEELETVEEGCLSLQGVLVEVERPVNVRVSAQDEQGERITVEASGLEARVIQHEMDHLDGVLILDRTSRSERKQAMKILRERERAAEDAVA